MSKRMRNILFAAAAVLVLGGLVLLLTLLPERKKTPGTTSSGMTSSENKDMMGYIAVYEFKEEEIQKVEVQNEYGSFTVTVRDKKLTISGTDGYAQNSSATDAFITSCMQFAATKVIADRPEDLTAYGITDKSPSVVLSTTGEVLHLFIGDNSSNGIYVYSRENEKVYLVESGWATPFLQKVTALLDLTIADGVSKDSDGNEIDPDVRKISYSGRGLKRPIVLQLNPEYTAQKESFSSASSGFKKETATATQFIFTSPFEADISDDKFSGKQYDYFALQAYDIYAIRPTAQQLSRCGLANPYVTIEVTAAKRSFKIDLGNTLTIDNKEYYYVRCSEKSPIFIAEAEHFNFFKEDMIHYMSALVVNVMIDDIKTLQMDYDGKSYRFELSGTGDDLAVRWNGKKMSTAEFRDLYQLVMLAYCEQSVEQGKYTAEPYLRLTYTYRHREKVDTIEYVKAGTRQYMIRRNGGDLALVRSKYVDTLIYGLTEFIAGRDVPSDY